MPPIFYVEVLNRQVNRVEGQSNPKERKIITRYYTEFDPDPETVMDRLFGALAGDDLPPIFYEIEGLSNSVYKRIPSAGGVKPLGISISQGNWADRIDWTAQWEVLDEVQEPLQILGLTLYDWQKTISYGQEASENLFGHKIFNTSENSSGDLNHLRERKPLYNFSGKMIGEPNYSTMRSRISNDNSVIDFSWTYNPITEVSDVTVTMTEDESLDGVRNVT